MSESLSFYLRAKADYESAWKRLQGSASGALKELAQGLFDKFPKVNSFTWHQYTPYYNDGEACIFHVERYPEALKVNDYTLYEAENARGDEEYPIPPKEAFDSVEELLDNFPDEILEQLFEDHVEVTMHRNGNTMIAGYSHD